MYLLFDWFKMKGFYLVLKDFVMYLKTYSKVTFILTFLLYRLAHAIVVSTCINSLSLLSLKSSSCLLGFILQFKFCVIPVYLLMHLFLF